MNSKSNFLIRKVHSLLGIIPVGIFICVHLLINSSVFFGGYANYEFAVAGMKSIPLIVAAEIIIIAIPIAIHAIYGLWIVYVAKNNALKFTYFRNWAFYLQRITALITLAFVLVHVYTLRFAQHEPAAVVHRLMDKLQNQVYFFLYVIGLAAAVFHFTNGFFTFLISWGITIGDRSQAFFSKFSLALFLALGVLGVSILTVIAGF